MTNSAVKNTLTNKLYKAIIYIKSRTFQEDCVVTNTSTKKVEFHRESLVALVLLSSAALGVTEHAPVSKATVQRVLILAASMLVVWTASWLGRTLDARKMSGSAWVRYPIITTLFAGMAVGLWAFWPVIVWVIEWNPH